MVSPANTDSVLVDDEPAPFESQAGILGGALGDATPFRDVSQSEVTPVIGLIEMEYLKPDQFVGLV